MDQSLTYRPIALSATAHHRPARAILALVAAVCLPGCTTLGSLLSPYSEKFSCKNDDHGRCIHPSRAYDDAVAGARSLSDPAVTNDMQLLGKESSFAERGRSRDPSDYGRYRDSVYRELKDLIDAPVTPMLKPPRTVRTLILPYADRQYADRLYMPRYVYSIVDRPAWVIGGALIPEPERPDATRILDQVQAGAPSGAAVATSDEESHP